MSIVKKQIKRLAVYALKEIQKSNCWRKQKPKIRQYVRKQCSNAWKRHKDTLARIVFVQLKNMLKKTKPYKLCQRFLNRAKEDSNRKCGKKVKDCNKDASSRKNHRDIDSIKYYPSSSLPSLSRRTSVSSGKSVGTVSSISLNNSIEIYNYKTAKVKYACSSSQLSASTSNEL